MNNQITTETERASSFCAKTFEVEGRQVTNSFKCNQPHFTAAESWNILKKRKEFSRRGDSMLLV